MPFPKFCHIGVAIWPCQMINKVKVGVNVPIIRYYFVTLQVI